MSTFKKISAITLSSVMCVGMLAGCGSSSSGTVSNSASGDVLKIGFVNEANTDVFDSKRMDALVSLVKENPDKYSIECTDANLDIQKQIDQAKTFIAKGVDVLMLVPTDSEGIVPAIKEANNAGIPAICFGIAAASGDFTYIGSPNYEAGKMQGEFMAEKLEQGASVMYLAGTAGLSHSAERRQGFQEALKAAGRDDIVIESDQDGDYVKDEGMRITETWIQKYGDGKGGVTFDAIVAANDQMALGAVEALKSTNILKGNNEILVSGIDGTDDGVQAVLNGYMAQTVLQDAPGQAAAALEALDKIAAGEEIESEILVDFVNITAENAEEYK